MKCKHSTRANQLRQRAQRRNGIRKKHQDETTHDGVERSVTHDVGHIGLEKAHIVQSSFGYAGPSTRNRAGVALDSDDFSGSSNQPGCQERYVSNPGTDIQNPLPWADARLLKEPLGVRSKTCRLSDQAFVFRVGASERVRSKNVWCHVGE